MISVIVPVYNAEAYLSRCMESILNQTYRDIQVICVNDGSTDSSGDMLEELRRRGITVLLIHHAGKSGDQRGTSAREDIMDTVISLRRPREYSMAEGARFEVHLTKARGILGDDAKPFEANLVTEGNVLQWHIKELEDVELEELKRLLSEGYSVRDCAEEIDRKSVV